MCLPWLRLFTGGRSPRSGRTAEPVGFRPLCWLLVILGFAGAVHGQEPAREAAAAPRDHIVARAYLEDPGGQARFDQVRNQAFTPYQGTFNRGYTDAVHWIRLSLAASASPLVLRLTPAWVDEITVFDPAGSGPRTVGDRHPVTASDHPALGFALDLPASETPRDIWLRLQTTSVHRLQAQAIARDQFPQAAATSLTWVTVYAASLLIMLVLLSAAWAVWRDAVLGTFLVRHVSFTAFALSYMGLPTFILGGQLPPVVFDLGFSMVVALTFPLSVWFDITLLSTFNPHRLLLRGAKLLMLGSVVVVLLVVQGQIRLGLQFNVMLMMIATLWVWVMAISCRPDAATERLMSRWMMLGYYTLILAAILSGLLEVKGWADTDQFGANVLVVHGLVTGLLMMAMLFVRSQRQALRSQEMAWQLSQARLEVEAEQRRRQEQSQFLHMLMHELKTPLSVVSFALGTRDNKEHNLRLASRAVQDMKAVIDRCVQADRMGELALQPMPESLDMAQEVSLAADALPDLAARLQLQGSTLQACVDRQLLQSVLANLLDNARRYGDPSAPVDVHIGGERRGSREGVRIRVANPPGLAGWPDPDRIFSKYYRSTGAQRDSGSGLGLFLSRQLATTLGGQLSYQPTDTQVQFELWIPQTPD